MPDVGLSGLGDDPISVIIGLIALIILLPFLLIALIAGLELLLLLLVLPIALLGRVVLGRHWTVEVRHGWTPYAEQPAGDWQESGLPDPRARRRDPARGPAGADAGPEGRRRYS